MPIHWRVPASTPNSSIERTFCSVVRRLEARHVKRWPNNGALETRGEMFWIIALAVPVLGAAIHLMVRPEPASAEAIGTIGLLWLAGAFYGVVTFVAGLQHLITPDRIAKYIGWPIGSGFQRELGWATVGIGAAGMLAPWLGPLYALGPCVAGAIFSIGAAIGHAQEIRKKGNLSPGNAGPVFYVDILAPLLTVVAIWLATPWR